MQHTVWSGAGVDLLAAAARVPAWKHIVILAGAGVLIDAGQLILV